MPLLAKLFIGSFIGFLQSTIRNRDSRKAQQVRAIVLEVRDACSQFLEVFD